jgi:CHAT domain-containing protein
LSACQTASGDKRAALGLAGVAVRAGARSTIASLWYVSDRATAQLMTEFYRQLSDRPQSKAQALRGAQQALLQNEEFSTPYFWSAFVLVGNWL